MHRNEVPRWGTRWSRWGLGLAVWTVLGVCEATQTYFSHVAERDPISWAQAFGMGLTLWYGWAVMWLVVCQLVRRFPIEQRNWPRTLPLHLAAGVGLALAKLVWDFPVIRTFYCPTPHLLTFPVFYRMGLAGHFFPYMLIGWAMLGIAHTLDYYRRYQEHRLRTSELETTLARTQLQLLKAQLHPHFLFNALNSISALIHEDPEAADEMVARLGELLRLTLNVGVQEVPLWRELQFLTSYLAIEQVRFGPRLHVRREVSPDVLGAPVPYLLLQPLVENALRHGVARRAGPGRIVIRAQRVEGKVRLEVEDDGPGLPPAFREGVGLANSRARLNRLYGGGHAFRLQNGEGGGVRVTVDLPSRPAREEEAGPDSSDRVSWQTA